MFGIDKIFLNVRVISFILAVYQKFLENYLDETDNLGLSPRMLYKYDIGDCEEVGWSLKE